MVLQPAVRIKTTSREIVNTSGVSGINVEQALDYLLNEIGAIYLASLADWTATYSGSQLTTLTYSDYEGITNHSKTFTYTGSNLTSTSETFDYNGESWTIAVTLTYSSGKVQTKSTVITIT